MKTITLSDIEDSLRLLDEDPPRAKFPRAVVPNPFPGKEYPTRVAWSILYDVYPMKKAQQARGERYDAPILRRLAEEERPAGNPKRYHFSYIGKPNRYRALEALKILQHGPDKAVRDWWEAEFDTKGLLRWTYRGVPQLVNAFYAYHPYGTINGIITNFTHKLYPKRIGKRPCYNYKEKFTQEQVEHYYQWYQATFGEELKRPKPVAMKGTRKPTPEIHFVRYDGFR